MNIEISLDWNPAVGIRVKEVHPFRDAIQAAFESKEYGRAVKTVAIRLICRPEAFSQKKRFTQHDSKLEFDMIFNFNPLQQMDPETRKVFIREAMISIAKESLTTYNFELWNKAAFLADFTDIVRTVNWP